MTLYQYGMADLLCSCGCWNCLRSPPYAAAPAPADRGPGVGAPAGARGSGPAGRPPLPRLPGMPLTYASVAPGTVSPPPRARVDPPAGVRRPAGARAVHRLGGQGRRDDRADAGRRPARRAGAARRSARHVAPGRHHRRARPDRPRVPCDHGAYPSTLGYRASRSRCAPRVNEVICHGIPDCRRARGRRHRQHRHHRLHRRRARRHQRHLPAGDVDEESRLLVERTQRGADARHQGGRARAARST